MIKNADIQHINDAKNVKKILVIGFLTVVVFFVFAFIGFMLYLKHVEKMKQDSYASSSAMPVYSLISKDVVQLKNLFNNNDSDKAEFIRKIKDAHPGLKIDQQTIYSTSSYAYDEKKIEGYPKLLKAAYSHILKSEYTNAHFKINITDTGLTFKGNRLLCGRVKNQIKGTNIKFYKENTLITQDYDCQNFSDNANARLVF